jgi:hypothetical protein
MPIVMIMRWEGVVAEQYRALRAELDLETNPPPGGKLHIAAFDERGVRVTDVWDSAEAFNRFVEERLMPTVGKLGIPGQPQVEIYPLESIFAPGYVEKS